MSASRLLISKDGIRYGERFISRKLGLEECVEAFGDRFCFRKGEPPLGESMMWTWPELAISRKYDRVCAFSPWNTKLSISMIAHPNDRAWNVSLQNGEQVPYGNFEGAVSLLGVPLGATLRPDDLSPLNHLLRRKEPVLHEFLPPNLAEPVESVAKDGGRIVTRATFRQEDNRVLAEFMNTDANGTFVDIYGSTDSEMGAGSFSMAGKSSPGMFSRRDIELSIDGGIIKIVRRSAVLNSVLEATDIPISGSVIKVRPHRFKGSSVEIKNHLSCETIHGVDNHQANRFAALVSAAQQDGRL